MNTSKKMIFKTFKSLTFFSTLTAFSYLGLPSAYGVKNNSVETSLSGHEVQIGVNALNPDGPSSSHQNPTNSDIPVTLIDASKLEVSGAQTLNIVPNANLKNIPAPMGSRIINTTIRFTAVGASTALVLYLKNQIPIGQSLQIGAFAGLMSAAFMYYNHLYQPLLSKPTLSKNHHKILQSLEPNAWGAFSDYLYNVLYWVMHNQLIHPQNLFANPLTDYLVIPGVQALLALFGQTRLDMANARLTAHYKDQVQKKLNEGSLTSEESFSQQQNLQRNSDFKALLFSVWNVASVVTDTTFSAFNVGKISFYFMNIAGGAFWIKALATEKGMTCTYYLKDTWKKTSQRFFSGKPAKATLEGN